MKRNSFLEKTIEELDIDKKIINKLKEKNINHIKDVWILKRKDLKEYGLVDSEINQIAIKLELHGLDLNKKKY